MEFAGVGSMSICIGIIVWYSHIYINMHIYYALLTSCLGITVCSGDADAVVPVTGTRYSIDALNLTTLVSWYPWYDHKQVHNQNIPPLQNAMLEPKVCRYFTHFLTLASLWYMIQVGEWSQVYKGLTFVTVGAGHEVPLHCPRQALILDISYWIGLCLPVNRTAFKIEHRLMDLQLA